MPGVASAWFLRNAQTQRRALLIQTVAANVRFGTGLLVVGQLRAPRDRFTGVGPAQRCGSGLVSIVRPVLIGVELAGRAAVPSV